MSTVLAQRSELSESGFEGALTESAGKKSAGTKPAFKVSPLYEGDTSVDLSDPFYSEENMRWIDEAGKRIRAGRVVIKTIEELEAMER